MSIRSYIQKLWFVGLLLVVLPAKAQFFERFDINMGTELPVDFSVRATGHLSERFFLSAKLGYSSVIYSGLFQSMTMGVNQEQSLLLAQSIADSATFELGGGYKFDGRFRPFISGGLFMISGGAGNVNGSDMQNFIADRGLNFFWIGGLPSFLEQYQVSSNVTALAIRGGMQYQASQDLTLNFEGGIIKALSADTNITNILENPSNIALLNEEVDFSWQNSVQLVLAAYVTITL